MKYNKSLDSLRAIAVLLVIFAHYGYLDCGWIGVQLFFVLSGYLITGILINEKSYSLRFYLKRFYWRRTLRIFPLYYGYLLLFTVFNLLLKYSLFQPERKEYEKIWPWLFSYTFNYAQVTTGYKGIYFFHHLWSLCVEEQFYLIWPLIVFLLSFTTFKRLLFVLIIIAPVLRFSVFQYLLLKTGSYTISGIGAYVLPLSQIDAFAMGALITIMEPKNIIVSKKRLIVIVYSIIIIGLLNLLFIYDSQTVKLSSFGFPSLMIHNYQYVWGYTIINALGMAIILLLTTNKTINNWAQNRLLVRIGKISYGIYLFHLPILDLWGRVFKTSPDTFLGVFSFLCYLMTTITISYISYELYEKHFLKLKDTKYSFT